MDARGIRRADTFGLLAQSSMRRPKRVLLSCSKHPVIQELAINSVPSSTFSSGYLILRIRISTKSGIASLLLLPISCLLQSYMTAWSSEEAQQDFCLRRGTLVYTAVVPSFLTPSFPNEGIHANHHVFTRDDIP